MSPCQAHQMSLFKNIYLLIVTFLLISIFSSNATHAPIWLFRMFIAPNCYVFDYKSNGKQFFMRNMATTFLLPRIYYFNFGNWLL